MFVRLQSIFSHFAIIIICETHTNKVFVAIARTRQTYETRSAERQFQCFFFLQFYAWFNVCRERREYRESKKRAQYVYVYVQTKSSSLTYYLRWGLCRNFFYIYAICRYVIYNTVLYFLLYIHIKNGIFFFLKQTYRRYYYTSYLIQNIRLAQSV